MTTSSRRHTFPKVVPQKTPAKPLTTIPLVVNNTSFEVLLLQRNVAEQLLGYEDIFCQVYDLPYRKVIVRFRDTEYPEVSPMYLKPELPQKPFTWKVITSEEDMETIIELWMEL